MIWVVTVRVVCGFCDILIGLLLVGWCGLALLVCVWWFVALCGVACFYVLGMFGLVVFVCFLFFVGLFV